MIFLSKKLILWPLAFLRMGWLSGFSVESACQSAPPVFGNRGLIICNAPFLSKAGKTALVLNLFLVMLTSGLGLLRAERIWRCTPTGLSARGEGTSLCGKEVPKVGGMWR